MSLPEFSNEADWSEFLKSPVWTDVTDEDLATAFRRFQFSGRRTPARILMSELAVRIAAYAKAAGRTTEIAEETRSSCVEALVTPGSYLGGNLCVNTKRMVTARARYLARRRGLEQRRREEISTTEETHIDECSPNADAILLLKQILESIKDPKVLEGYVLVLKGHGLSGTNSVASKLGIKESSARALLKAAETIVRKKTKVDEDL